MEIVKFLNETWQEIPEQDNPAMNTFKTKEGRIKQECILIFKGKYQGTCNSCGVADGGFVVALNPKQGELIKKGIFWTVKDAELFAEVLAL